MRDCYHVADVAVSIPSSDGMPATIFEAMASLTPLIVSDLPAYDEVVVDGESGIRVPLKDENRLAEAILDLLTDEAKRKHFREKGLQIVKEKGDIEKEIEKVENLYRELIQEKSGGGFG
jgi:glycosyltransferase involved in cell wall biosynthesis